MGSIVSDVSETMLSGASVLKNAVGDIWVHRRCCDMPCAVCCRFSQGHGFQVAGSFFFLVVRRQASKTAR